MQFLLTLTLLVPHFTLETVSLILTSQFGMPSLFPRFRRNRTPGTINLGCLPCHCTHPDCPLAFVSLVLPIGILLAKALQVSVVQYVLKSVWSRWVFASRTGGY